jgi:hypothetical protein
MVGAVAGSPGTLPTNWGAIATGGLNIAVAGLGSESGLQYIDLRFNGTATAGLARIQLEAFTIAALNGQTWSTSTYAKIVAQPQPPLNYSLRQSERTSAGVIVTEGVTNISPTTTLQRFSFVRTLNGGATTAFVVPEIQFGVPIGATYDFTIRIAAPQMELGAYATTFIPTTTAAVTRLADVALKTGVSSLIGQTEGTLFVEINSANLESYTQRIFTASDDTTNNVIGFQLTAANQITFYVENGGANQVAITKATPAITLGQNVKIAAAYKANDFVLYVNGIQVGTDASGSVPATSVLRYANPGGANPYIGKISQAALFKTRLTPAQLVDITGGRIYYNPVEAYYAYYLTPEIPSAVITSVNSFF